MDCLYILDISLFLNFTLLYELYKAKETYISVLSNAIRHEWNVWMITINFPWPFAFKLIHHKTYQFSITSRPAVNFRATWTLKWATTHRFLWRIISSICPIIRSSNCQKSYDICLRLTIPLLLAWLRTRQTIRQSKSKNKT